MIVSPDDVAHAERIGALVNAAVAGPLAALAPHLAPIARPLAGGQVVLLGPGMYVNRGLARGLGVEVTTENLEALEAASAFDHHGAVNWLFLAGAGVQGGGETHGAVSRLPPAEPGERTFPCM